MTSFQMGWLYGRARHFDSALKVFSHVPESVPDRSTHDFAVALARFELGDYRGSADLLAGLESAGLADSKSENLLAVAYSKLGLYREAYAVLSREIRKNPAELDTHLNLITVYAEGGDFKGAAEAASETIKLFPASADAFVSHGAAQALLGQIDSAYEDFSRSAKLDPSRPDVRFFSALMDYKLDKFTQAIQILRIAINEGLQDSDLHYLLAECLLKADNGNRDEALEELNRAVVLNADSVSARTLRGKLLLESGQVKQAVSDLEFASKRDPEYRSAAYNLARAYRALGRNSEAQAIFARLRDQSVSTVSEMGDRRLNEALSPKSTEQQ
jgi:tetratricopeptide (TPR) repeat protein